MKIHGVKRIWPGCPIFLHFKKHYCPACNSILKPTKVAKVVNSKSEEAKNFDFSAGDVCMAGNIKFVWTELMCMDCNCTYSIKEMKTIEKNMKNK